MIHCTNCGQVNTDTSHFCRFCGNRFAQQQPSQPENYEYAPPRPYSWKTDEFQAGDTNNPRRASPINRVQPLPDPYATNHSARPQPLMHQAPQNPAYGFRCPRCSNYAMPVTARKISTAGWITFAVLLVMFFPLFWIGLLIKEEVRTCPACNFRYN